MLHKNKFILYWEEISLSIILNSIMLLLPLRDTEGVPYNIEVAELNSGQILFFTYKLIFSNITKKFKKWQRYLRPCVYFNLIYLMFHRSSSSFLPICNLPEARSIIKITATCRTRSLCSIIRCFSNPVKFSSVFPINIYTSFCKWRQLSPK